jgi:hypothetical protein
MPVLHLSELGEKELQALKRLVRQADGKADVIVHPGYRGDFNAEHMKEISLALKSGGIAFVTVEETTPQEAAMEELDRAPEEYADAIAQRAMLEASRGAAHQAREWLERRTSGTAVIVPTPFKTAEPKAGWDGFTSLLKSLGVKEVHVGGEELFMSGGRIDPMKGCVSQTHWELRKRGLNPRLREEWCAIRK